MPFNYTVKQGDCLSSIAAAFHFADYRTLYDAPENAAFKKKRPNPNIIYPGDELVIIDKVAKEVAAATGATHRFKLKRKPTLLRLVIDVDTMHRYVLSVGASEHRGTTDGASAIEHAVDPEAKDGKIALWPEADGAPDDPPDDAIRWSLQIGSLDPVEEISGVKGRLLNLGYYDGPVDGALGDLLLSAIRRFREDQGLPINDTLDQALRDKLVAAHDTL